VNALLSTLPAALWIVPIVFAIFAALVWYALSRKDEVNALFMHGKTVFRIEAKGRRQRR
jgi:cytochrome c-type biogenesis protein CcmH/NrfF